MKSPVLPLFKFFKSYILFLFVFLAVFLFLSPREVFANCNSDTECKAGYVCKSLLDATEEVGIEIPLKDKLPFIPKQCVPPDPTPTFCQNDPDCGLYKCDLSKHTCTDELQPLPTQAPTPDPLCPDNECHTALGTIPTQKEEFISKIFGILLSLSGGIALIIIIYSGYSLMASQGNPEKLQGAKETLTSAIVGLLFIIFSLVILQFIGVEILNVPGFINP